MRWSFPGKGIRLLLYPHPQHRLKKCLLDYSRRYPAICQQTDADPEMGCMEFDIKEGRFSFRLTAPYSEERRRAASEAAKDTAIGFLKSMVSYFEKLFSFI